MRWLAAGALLVLAGAAGCGSQYRPVINPVVPTGPASQPTAYAVVFSQPGLVPPTDPSLPASAPPCPGLATPPNVFQSYANPGVVTIVDFSGDSIMALAEVGNGPLGFAVDPTGALAYSENCDGTISSVPISTSLQTNKVASSTLLAGAVPINMLVATGSQFVVEQGRDAIAAMSGSPPALKQEIFVAPSVINVAGSQASQRVYSISQGSTGSSSVAWGDCANPSSVTSAGEADAIEIATNTISTRLPLGVCPVFGVMSADSRRTFVLNRGSGTITVINSQLNTLDTTPQASPYLNGTATINLCGGTTPCNAGPVYAELYTPGNILAVSNYDNSTISVIDVSLDVYGNDSPTFGKVLATVPVGSKPAMLTVLQDGSSAYTANQGDGTVTVVNLTSFTAQKTINLGSVSNPRTIVSTYNYPSGKVYVSSQSSSNLVVIRTDTDSVSATLSMQGNVVDVRTTNQYAGSTTQGGNNITVSRSAGSGVP
ncbi:MAG TPA: YncE family protein [Silvibacterium sp.]|nr:YncE family protein [Silvibacterium sp.]